MPNRDQDGTTQSIDVQRAHRLLVTDAADRLGEQRGHRQLSDLPAALRLCLQRDRVRHDQLIEHRFRNQIDGLARQHGMRDVGNDSQGALVLQRLRRHA